MALARMTVASITVAVGLFTAGAAVPASAASGQEDSKSPGGRAAVGAELIRSSGCSTYPDGSQVCYSFRSHDIEVLAHEKIVETYGARQQVTTETGTTTYSHVAHSQFVGSIGVTQAIANGFTIAEDGCKTIYSSRIINGTRTDSSHTVCP